VEAFRGRDDLDLIAEAPGKPAVVSTEIVSDNEFDLVPGLYQPGCKRSERRDIALTPPYLQPKFHVGLSSPGSSTFRP
jgi:hypothetical protein